MMFEDKDKQDQGSWKTELSGLRHGSLPEGKG